MEQTQPDLIRAVMCKDELQYMYNYNLYMPFSESLNDYDSLNYEMY